MSIFRHYDSEFGSYTDRQFQHPRGQGESLNCQISYDKLGFFKCQHGYIHSQEHLDKQMNAPLDIFREAPEEFLTNGKNNFYIYDFPLTMYKQYIRRAPRHKRQRLYAYLQSLIEQTKTPVSYTHLTLPTICSV